MPGKPISSASLLVPPAILLPIVIVLFGLRLHSRFSASGFGLDDWLLCAAVCAGLGCYIVSTISVANGLGHHINTLSQHQISILACLQLFIAEFYVWTSTFIKISIAWMIFRIQGYLPIWRQSLITMMGFLAALGVASCFWDYLQCRPINALWDFSYSRDHCSFLLFHKWVYAVNIMFVLTDVIFATLPIFFISKIRRPTREKIVLCFLMALGLLCAAVVIPKLIVLRDFSSMSDFTYTSAWGMLCNQIEVFIGIIAACIPVLKSFFEKALRKIGLMASTGATYYVGAGYIQPSEFGREEHLSFPKHTATVHTFSKLSARGENWDVAEESWIGLEEQMLKHTDVITPEHVAMQNRSLK